MKIGINASFARKMNTGIGQVTINFLKELSKSKRDKFVLYLEEDLPKENGFYMSNYGFWNYNKNDNYSITISPSWYLRPVKQ